ncbi:MAG TPA: isoprenylcysteine carboxylmethyltransferase family protein [Thermoanaerobaculia bacterium]|nr:isoprenylcysteine carboxylmethyltransferase family protein [Thermoanaerobaculia bacterium]
MSSAVAYTLLVLAVAGERVAELVVARRHERWLRGRGAVEAGAGHYPVMVALHSGFLVACLAEVWLLERPFVPALGAPALALVAGTMALRWWVIATLGRRWTTRVWVLPGEPRVAGGPFRWLPHPNYLAVAVELVALPLVHGAWWTALAFGGANLVLLRHRIRVENAALVAAERASTPSAAATGRAAGLH